MKLSVLSIGSDKRLFERGSAVSKRAESYGTLFERLVIIVFTKRGFEPESIGERVSVIPTNSAVRAIHPLAAWIRAVSLKERFDVITVQDPFESGLAGLMVKRSLSIPLHVQVHTDFLAPGFKRESALNILRTFIAERVLAKADSIRVVSETIKRKLVHSYGLEPSIIDVLPIHTDIESNIQAPKTGYLKEKFGKKFVILAASRLTKEKRLDRAIRAFSKMVDRSDAALVIVGDGPEKRRLQKCAADAGVAELVHFEGWKDDLRLYYASADAFILTSAYEGYGLTLIEAASFGLPIVSTDVGIARDLIGEGDFLCPTDDSDCLARALEKLGSDSTVREREGLRMKERVLAFSSTWEEYIRAYAASIQKALSAAS